jgi:uncharacterized protein (TIGR02452 family)
MLLTRNYLWKDIKYRYKNLNQNTLKYSFDKTVVTFPSIPAVISVHNEDTLDFPIINNIDNPLILIFADDVNPGGCIESGNGMQEESLFRRSGLFKYMTRNFYPLNVDEALYCKNVPVIRMSELRNNQEIPERYYSFVAAACLKSEDMDLELLKNKIELILRIAVKNSHKNVILGAWGCGAFGCNSMTIAQIFKEVCLKFDLRIYFVILGKSYNVFCDVFKDL